MMAWNQVSESRFIRDPNPHWPNIVDPDPIQCGSTSQFFLQFTWCNIRPKIRYPAPWRFAGYKMGMSYLPCLASSILKSASLYLLCNSVSLVWYQEIFIVQHSQENVRIRIRQILAPYLQPPTLPIHLCFFNINFFKVNVLNTTPVNSNWIILYFLCIKLAKKTLRNFPYS